MKKLLMLSVAIATITVAAVSMADVTSVAAYIEDYIEENLGLDSLRLPSIDPLRLPSIDPMWPAAELAKHN